MKSTKCFYQTAALSVVHVKVSLPAWSPVRALKHDVSNITWEGQLDYTQYLKQKVFQKMWRDIKGLKDSMCCSLLLSVKTVWDNFPSIFTVLPNKDPAVSIAMTLSLVAQWPKLVLQRLWVPGVEQKSDSLDFKTQKRNFDSSGKWKWWNRFSREPGRRDH